MGLKVSVLRSRDEPWTPYRRFKMNTRLCNALGGSTTLWTYKGFRVYKILAFMESSGSVRLLGFRGQEFGVSSPKQDGTRHKPPQNRTLVFALGGPMLLWREGMFFFGFSVLSLGLSS